MLHYAACLAAPILVLLALAVACFRCEWDKDKDDLFDWTDWPFR